MMLLRQPEDGEGTSPSVQGDAWGWCQPQNCPFLGERWSCPHLPAAKPPGAIVTLSSSMFPQRHKKALGTWLHQHLWGSSSCCRFSSKPSACWSHSPAADITTITTSCPPLCPTPIISWQLMKRRVTCSPGGVPAPFPGHTDHCGDEHRNQSLGHDCGAAAHLPQLHQQRPGKACSLPW